MNKVLIPLFDNMDRDDSGTLDFKEVEMACKRFGMKMKKGQLREEFKKMDEDGDGELTKDEFLEFGAFWFEQLKKSESMSSFGGEDNFEVEGIEMSHFKKNKSPIVGKARRQSINLDENLTLKIIDNEDFGRDKSMHSELKRLGSSNIEEKIGSERLDVLRGIYESLQNMETEIESTVKQVKKIQTDEEKRQNVEPEIEVVPHERLEYQHVNTYKVATQERKDRKNEGLMKFAQKHGDVVKRRQSLVTERKIMKQRGRTTSTIGSDWRRQHLGLLLYFLYDKYDKKRLPSIAKTIEQSKNDEDYFREETLVKITLPRYKLTEADLQTISEAIETRTKKVSCVTAGTTIAM